MSNVSRIIPIYENIDVCTLTLQPRPDCLISGTNPEIFLQQKDFLFLNLILTSSCSGHDLLDIKWMVDIVHLMSIYMDNSYNNKFM